VKQDCQENITIKWIHYI